MLVFSFECAASTRTMYIYTIIFKIHAYTGLYTYCQLHLHYNHIHMYIYNTICAHYAHTPDHMYIQYAYNKSSLRVEARAICLFFQRIPDSPSGDNIYLHHVSCNINLILCSHAFFIIIFETFTFQISAHRMIIYTDIP